MPFWWSGQRWTVVQRKLSHWFLWWCSFSIPFLTLLCLHPNISSFDQCHVLSRDCYWLSLRSIQVLYSPLHLQIIWSPVRCISRLDYSSQCLSLVSLFEPCKAGRQWCCNQASPPRCTAWNLVWDSARTLHQLLSSIGMENLPHRDLSSLSSVWLPPLALTITCSSCRLSEEKILRRRWRVLSSLKELWLRSLAFCKLWCMKKLLHEVILVLP